MENIDMAITEDELHGFVDGVLSEERRMQVEQWLDDHPEDSAKVQKWFKQNEVLQNMFTLAEENLTNISFDDDEALILTMGKKFNQTQKVMKFNFNWRMIVAALPMLIIGGVIGSLGTLQFNSLPKDMTSFAYVQDLAEVSRASFAIYTNEKKHPVEVGVDDKKHLIAWLGKRVNKDLTPPNLTDKGFSLVGGRILPLEGKPSAMLMYEDATGERLTLMIGENKDNENTGFSFAQKEG
ncbi:MAG: anti-sigma factor, partial [Rhizobiales bacterium]|nr:anti-sigma factor [Hyphomicrobiales bacterium]